VRADCIDHRWAMVRLQSAVFKRQPR
jgi:hypothetical protein